MSLIEKIIQKTIVKNPAEPEFIQAVKEVLESIEPVIEKHKEYAKVNILERIIEPDRALMFRVPWVDDKGEVNVNRGFRVQFNNAIGPYKGGIRFHPTVNLGIIKFLGFEQVFKNALTTLPMGGAKGGADFDPKGKSDSEVMRFCQSFMRELYRHIGEHTDIPAGDIGVGAREVGFLNGYYRKITNNTACVLTGKTIECGGSLIRPEATGYGAVYFAQEMLKTIDETLDGKICAVSGSGNVAQYTVEKINDLGGKCVTLSDSSGMIYDADGITPEKLAWVMELKNIKRGRIKEYADKFKVEYHEGANPWGISCDCAFPSATQNEINEEDAKKLIKNGCYVISEGANMPSTPEAADIFIENKILYGPGKAANAGGVAVSGIEMSQNAMRLSWHRDEIDNKLRVIMSDIHKACVEAAEEYGQPGNYVVGANIAGFLKTAKAMYIQGVV